MRATETDLAFVRAFTPSTSTALAPSPALKESVDWQFAYGALQSQYSDAWGQWRPAQILGSRQNRVQGKDYYKYWSEYDLHRQVDLARYLDASNPIAQGAVNKLVSFVLQSGAQYKIVPKAKGIKPPESYITQGQDVMDGWQDQCKWRRKEKEHVRCAIVEGEILLHKARSEDGEPTIRRPEPEQLQSPPGKGELDGWRLGVRHEIGDVCKVLGYNINWMLGTQRDQPYGVFVPADRIIHLKRNVVESVARGVSDFFSNADDLDKIDRALDAIGAGTIARAKIAYFRTHKDALPGAVQNFANANATGTFYNPITQRTENKFVPTDAAIADVPDTVGVETMPTGNTQESIEAVNLLIRLTIANRWDMPEFIASADASNNNYASILVSGSPFVIAIRQNQSDFADVWRDCMNWIITVRMAQGIIPLDFFDVCKVEVTLPDPTVSDELEAEQIRDIRFRNKILSPQTYSAQARLNYDDELVNKRQALADDPMFAMDSLPDVGKMNGADKGDKGKDDDERTKAKADD